MSNNHNLGREVTNERRRESRLTDDQVDEIAYRAADIVIEAIYIEIGKVTIRAILFLGGAIGTALLSWFGFVQKIGAGG